MTTKKYALIMTSLVLAACGAETPDAETRGAETPDIATRAQQIADSSLLIDTHIDVPMRLVRAPVNIAEHTEDGDFDYPRAVAGGLNVPFMSIYTSASLEEQGKSKEAADRLIDAVEKAVADAPDKFAIARSTADVERQFMEGLMSLPMGMENGAPIDGDLDNLRHFYDRGIRYVTLTHSLSNHISDSSYDDNRRWNGLSDFGKEVVREMNRIGMMIDVSHVSDEAFWQVIEFTKTPVIASHSSARHFTPGFERNMNDEMIVALAENGGVIQINFGSSFVTAEARAYMTAMFKARKEYLAANPNLDASEAYATFATLYAEEHGPFPYATLDDVLDHFDHVVKLAGIDHVGIGSDYDGVGDSLPVGLKDVSSYPNLIAGLLQRGYSEEDVRKILGGNLMRVWKAVESYAATTSSST
jgi:membrane dipeptidase